MKPAPSRCGVVGLALAGSLTCGFAWSQSYPVKPVRLILAGPAAGGLDVIVRPIAQRLSESVGQSFVVENRPGAGGVLAAQTVASSAPDGYTLLFATASGLSIAPFLLKKRPYDPLEDFVPAALVALAPLMVTVHPSLPVKSVQELIGLARARPKELLYASNGTGSLSHLTTEMFCRSAGIALVHVPYKGGSPAVIDTVSGQTQMVITAVPTLLVQVRAARLRALAVTGASRSSAVPELPTVAESGLAGFEAVQWYGLFAPKNTQAGVTDKLVAEIRKAAESPNVKSALALEGAEVSVAGSQALARLHRADIAKWQKVIRESNIVLE